MVLILLSLFAGIGMASDGMKLISGTGSGELLLNFTIHSITPVFSGSYSYDLADLHIPPISSAFNPHPYVKLSKSITGNEIISPSPHPFELRIQL